MLLSLYLPLFVFVIIVLLLSKSDKESAYISPTLPFIKIIDVSIKINS